ncbi:hypothetical protein [Dictyobacter halimunensis]|uniref:hypothetical protein n=1 Tax=Dictyobacter halimunensis TaxID=3026934 RepID=UPI0030C67456
MLDVRGSMQEGGQLGSVDGGTRERREHVSDDALEIGVNVLGVREWHGLQACPEGIRGGVVQPSRACCCASERPVR